MYRKSFFPTLWRHSHIIPIPKPGKNHSEPTNYRPIALTSTVCKTMERMINHRLLDYLDMNKKISRIQCGGRKHRSTLDHLISLETTVRKAFAHSQHIITVFFDLEKAYDRTWKYGILKDLYRKGLRGNLSKYIEQF